MSLSPLRERRGLKQVESFAQSLQETNSATQQQKSRLPTQQVTEQAKKITIMKAPYVKLTLSNLHPPEAGGNSNKNSKAGLEPIKSTEQMRTTRSRANKDAVPDII